MAKCFGHYGPFECVGNVMFMLSFDIKHDVCCMVAAKYVPIMCSANFMGI